jgi:hypothetical protein
MLGKLTSLFQAYQEMTSKDEMVFGEIIRQMIEMERPMVTFNASDGFQTATFLMNDSVLHSLKVTLDKKIGSISTLSFQGSCRNMVADPDDMIAMYKTDFQNILKMPMFGQMKINHEYNRVYATVTGIRKLSEYMTERTTVNSKLVAQDLKEKTAEITEALRKFKK